MPVIELRTFIAAPRERVFDLARSIDAHLDTAMHTGERAVAGVTTGLLGMGDEVTWRASHFGVTQRLTVRMTSLETDRGVRGVEEVSGTGILTRSCLIRAAKPLSEPLCGHGWRQEGCRMGGWRRAGGGDAAEKRCGGGDAATYLLLDPRREGLLSPVPSLP